jgi:3-hydroxyisobutyrate dehydrogenase
MQDQNRTSRVLIGESFVGEGAEAAHVNTVLGGRDGPVGTAWATALAMPRPGHSAFVTILRPNLPVKPLTLFVNKAAMADERHGDLTWGAAQAGVAGGVADAVADGVISSEEAEDLLLIAAIWVNPAARDAELVYQNNRAATRKALENGATGAPKLDEILAARHEPANPFFTAGLSRTDLVSSDSSAPSTSAEPPPHPERSMKVGFIGLGYMGGPMSRNILSAGHDLLVHDIRREVAAGLEVAGAAWAATPRDTAVGREAVITMLPAPAHVERVLLGPDGLLSGLAPGSVWIDMSTSVPAVADRVRAVAGDVAVLDAPVSGMAAGARAGTLQIFVGGEESVFHRVRPLLEAMGDPERILYVGGHGAGYTVKLMINLLWFAHLVATAEVLTIGTQAGVDLATLRRCLLASPAASNFLERDVLSVLEAGDYDDSFALALACKDLGLAVDLAGHAGVPAEVSAVVEQVYRRARAQYGDAGGEMLPIKLYEDLTRTPLRLPPVSAPGSHTPPPSLAPPRSLASPARPRGHAARRHGP